MLETIKMYTYVAFGLTVRSPILLPELIKKDLGKEKSDITVELASLDTEWNTAADDDTAFVVKKNHVLFQVQDTATYKVQNGDRILVSPMVNVTEDKIRLFLLGTCMGIILLQRGILPLHGSAVNINGRAYAFVGDSGAGKSTLASAFLKRGFQLISDDVIPVTLDQDQIPMVTPSYPQQKLWQESLNHFGENSHKYRPIIERETKFAVPVASQFTSNPLPLGGIIELLKDDNEEIEFQTITGLHCLQTLFYHTYRNFILNPAGLRDWHFKMSTHILKQSKLFQLKRPISRFTAHELVSLILDRIYEEENAYDKKCNSYS